MSEKRTIRDVTIERRRPGAKVTKDATSTPNVIAKKPRQKRVSQTRRMAKRERTTMWIIALLVLLILGIFLANVFGGTRVTIVPEQKTNDISLTLTADRNAGNNELRFDIMVIEDTVSETVPATESREVERRASGDIVIFNENSTSQNLREETRFESPDGLIYKTAKGAGITIPGAQGDTPGSLEVTVYADQPGAEYNIGLVDFVIPGWREINDPRFETQYARSKTAMTGGFIGTERTVDPDEQVRIASALDTALEQRLLISADAQKTEDFVFFEDGTILNKKTVEQGEGTDESVDLVVGGTLTTILFNKQELSSIIASEVFPTYDGEPVLITNFDELQVAFTGLEGFTPSTTEKVTFEISGTPTFEWLIDEDALKEALAGKQKRAFNATLQSFTGINRAELSVQPFWKTKISEKVDDIRVELVDSSVQ